MLENDAGKSGKYLNRDFSADGKGILHFNVAPIQTECGDPRTKLSAGFSVRDFCDRNEGKSWTATGLLIHEETYSGGLYRQDSAALAQGLHHTGNCGSSCFK